ncbi:hypothetical protein QC762_104350 [Podospora pseudocomata]|uniref:Uncharacterized protein n=1 Tax=Podospora pseudocomata TaxID=2093779 RepID=A0ABR0GSM8_9PEZI|nr:hypothetical protein QC762_104350 [Podospora pseudocomata]
MMKDLFGAIFVIRDRAAYLCFGPDPTEPTELCRSLCQEQKTPSCNVSSYWELSLLSLPHALSIRGKPNRNREEKM